MNPAGTDRAPDSASELDPPSSAESVPVIAIDGPSGAGKGSAARVLASRLGYHLLDSGAVYRAAALHVLRERVPLDQPEAVLDAVLAMQASYLPSLNGVHVRIKGEDVTRDLRSEDVAGAASVIAAMPAVRKALLPQQRSFRRRPGLVADGRDMGTVVFPEATLKVFLTASAEERARRRAKELEARGIPFIMESLLQDIEQRDRRDSTRAHSPLIAADGALLIDSSFLTIDEVVHRICNAIAM